MIIEFYVADSVLSLLLYACQYGPHDLLDELFLLHAAALLRPYTWQELVEVSNFLLEK